MLTVKYNARDLFKYTLNFFLNFTFKLNIKNIYNNKIYKLLLSIFLLSIITNRLKSSHILQKNQTHSNLK